MEPSGRRADVFDWVWFLVWGVASSLWCWTAAWQLGATFDEPVYVARGLEVWRTGSHCGLLQLGTMPLPVDLNTLPLYLWESGQGIRLDAVRDLPRLLPWARAGTLLFWWVLLIYGRLAGRSLAGPWGGRLAVAMLACEPSLLAHASLATTDIAVTACLLALTYHFRVGRQAHWLGRVGIPGFWFGAALLAKASALVFGPLCLFVLELEFLFSRGAGCDCPLPIAERRFVPALKTTLYNLQSAICNRDAIQIGGLGLLLAFLYCGSDWQAQPSFVEWAHRLPEGPSNQVLVWLADHLRVFTNAGEGFVRQIKHNVRGHGTYLLGEVADRAIWYYFPVALSIKLSEPLLILPAVLLVVRPRALANWAVLAAVALLVFSLTCRVQIGIRLVLPLIALAVIGLAAAVVRGSAPKAAGTSTMGSDLPSAKGPRMALTQRAAAFMAAVPLGLLAGAGVVWTTLSALAVWPHGLCYTNELWGGTACGYRLVSDSNYDWGQGLIDLARWQQCHRDVPLDVWYFGSDPALRTLPFREVPFHTMAVTGIEEIKAQIQGHYLAVSTTLLHGSVSTIIRKGSPEWESYWRVLAFLSEREPVDRTMTFLIYDLSRPDRQLDDGPLLGQPLTRAPSDPLP